MVILPINLTDILKILLMLHRDLPELIKLIYYSMGEYPTSYDGFCEVMPQVVNACREVLHIPVSSG